MFDRYNTMCALLLSLVFVPNLTACPGEEITFNIVLFNKKTEYYLDT
jgi:hypothetical protein